MSWDVGPPVGPLCLTAQRLAPRHQLYLAMRLRLGEGVPGSSNQALSSSVRSQGSAHPQGQRQTLVLTPQATQRDRRDLPKPFSASQELGVQPARWDGLCGRPTSFALGARAGSLQRPLLS